MASPPRASIGWKQVLAWRAARHHLDARVPARRALQVASELCGLHAQLTGSAELTLWARIEGLRRGEMAAALWTDRKLVKTWAMRGTLHLLPTAEYRLWQAGLATYRHYLKPAWLRAFGVSEPELKALVEAIGEALRKEPLTRDDLAVRVGRLTRSRALGDKLRESWGALLKPAAFQGRLCFGPGEGARVRFIHPDQWLGAGQGPDGAAARREIFHRYLAVHGPATREDLARWWGTTPAEAGRVLRELGERVTPVLIDGAGYWAAADAVDQLRRADPARTARLLPAFDQYVIAATRQIAGFLPSPALKELVYRQQGWISPVLVVSGRIEGTWEHERKGRRIVVRIAPFGSLAAWARRAAALEAEQLAAFLGGTLDLEWVAPKGARPNLAAPRDP